MEINNRLKIIRKELNLTQAEFGEKIGLTQSYVANLENSKRELSIKLIKSICSIFNIQENWLITGTGDMFTPKKNLSSNIIDTFKELKPEFQEYIIRQINELLIIQNNDKGSN